MDYVRFEQLCIANNTTPTAVTKKIGLKKGNTTSWKKGGNPSVEVLSQLADELNCTADELMGRKLTVSSKLTCAEQELLTYYNALDESTKEKAHEIAEFLSKLASDPKPDAGQTVVQPARPAEDLDLAEDRIIYIETYSLPASAGSGVDLDGCEKEQIAVRENELTSDANFAVRVSGKSMEPAYHDGDIVLVRTQPEVELGQIGIFTVNDMGYIKQCGKHELISINERYDNIPISASDSCYCRGLVIGILDPDDLA